MSSSLNSGSQTDEVVTYDPKAFAEFLAKNQVIPLSLVTLCSLPGCVEATVEKPNFPADPCLRVRKSQTENQSDFGLKESMYDRVTIGGEPIQDNGVKLLQGAMSFGALKSILGRMDTAQYVVTDQGGGKSQKKVELRYRGNRQSGQDGWMNIVEVQRSLGTIPDDHLVGFFLWVNPSHGWLRFNLVIVEWNRKVASRQPLAELEMLERDGIPTINIERFGFNFPN